LGEFANAKSLKAYEEIAGKNEEFLAKRQKMSTLTRKVELPNDEFYIGLHTSLSKRGNTWQRTIKIVKR
jgi:hypothetical protein